MQPSIPLTFLLSLFTGNPRLAKFKNSDSKDINSAPLTSPRP